MKQNTIFSLTFIAVLVAVLAVSAPLRASETDDKIASSLRQTYVYKTYLKEDSIKVAVDDRVVTLTGTVAGEFHKSLAQETAASMAGVASVENMLSTEAEVAAADADAWIGQKVKLALFFHSNVSAGQTTVFVKDGVVTLKGEASSIAQKELTTEYTQDIEGVTEVNNEMTIAAAPEKAQRTEGVKIDDASITAQVKTALAIHRSTSSILTGVVTLAGEVTLTGIARNEAEKSLVTKLTKDIKGVTNVKNDMSIDESKTE